MSDCCPTCGALRQGTRRPTLLQRRALEAIGEFTAATGYAPTNPQLGQMLGIRNYQQTYELVRSLILAGRLAPRPTRAAGASLPFRREAIVLAPPARAL